MAKRPTRRRRKRSARVPGHGSLGMERYTVSPALFDKRRRAEWGLPSPDGEPGRYVVELNLLHEGGIEGADKKFNELYNAVIRSKATERRPKLVSKAYYSCLISVNEWRKLVNEDERSASGDRSKLAIYKIWPDFPVRATLDRSVTTVKADAAVRTFAATGSEIAWAVIDSGIDKNHPHFAKHANLLHDSVAQLHHDFTGSEGEPLRDDYGHGTHVAGIIAGEVGGSDKFEVYQKVYKVDPDDGSTTITVEKRKLANGGVLAGVAPSCRLVSLKVLDANGAGRTSDVIMALSYIRERVNGDPKLLRIHGVNLSVGYEFDAEMFACGQSPLCVEVNRLVKSGVVVVAAAGNTGYGTFTSDQRPTRIGVANTINDPGNAALAITVGSTHRDSPHNFGVSYFSSKGPTGDGRLKPDLVAPGERITSCATGRYLIHNGGSVPDAVPAYIDESGTSMAAPHVSGAIAAFLSIRREFIQYPERVKEIFLASATSLGRERYFEGRGLVDLMRAIQSI